MKIDQDHQKIHNDCREQFICVSEFSGYGAQDIELAGISELHTEYQIGRYKPVYHHLLFTTQGAGTLKYDAGEIAIEPDTMTLLPAGSCFYYELASFEWHTCWFLLKDALMWRQLRKVALGVYQCHSCELIKSTLSLLSKHHAVYAGTENKKESELLAILKFYIDEALNSVQQSTHHGAKLQMFFNELQGQLHLPWTTEMIASELHISEPHLFRICQQVMGKSPMQYLLELRLQHACELLKHTRLGLEQIANTVGYQDAGSFSQRFRKSIGIAPGAWRKQAR